MRAVGLAVEPHLLQEVDRARGGGIRAEGDVDPGLQHLLDLAGDVEHEDVGRGAPGHVRAGASDLLDVLVREADAVDQDRVLVEAAQLLQDLDPALRLLVEALLQVRDEGEVALLCARVLDLDPVAPLQVEGGALVGEGVVADDAHGQARDERLVPLVREMIVGRDDAGEDVLVRAEEVALLHARLCALHLDDVGVRAGPCPSTTS